MCNSEILYKKVERRMRKKSEYYKAAFALIDNCGKYIWNWPACLFGWVWALYRKMYLYSFFGFIIDIALYTLFGDDNQQYAFSILYTICMICWGHYGNVLYYSALKKKIKLGFHLMDEHRATSFFGAASGVFGLILMPIVDYFAHKKYFSNHKLKDNEITAEHIDQYLNPKKKHSTIMKIAIAFALVSTLFLFSKFMIYTPAASNDTSKTVNLAETHSENVSAPSKISKPYAWPTSGCDTSWLARTIKAKFKN